MQDSGEEFGGDISFFAQPRAKRRKPSAAAARGGELDPAHPPSSAPPTAGGRPLTPAQPGGGPPATAAPHGEPLPESAAAAAGLEAGGGGGGDAGGEVEPGAVAVAEAQPAEEEPPEGITFRQLGLNEWLDRVCRSLGMAQPTQVGAATLPT